MKSFGETVAFFMAQSGIRQVDLAEKSGLGKPYISKILSGRRTNPEFEKACDIIDALGVGYDEFRAEQRRD